MAGSEAYRANRRWLKAAFAGNAPLPDDAIRVQIDRRGSTSGEARIALDWTRSAGRARRRDRKPDLDEQIKAALEKGSPLASLRAALAARPAAWLRGGKGQYLPGWSFARTFAEICSSCSGLRSHPCGSCGQTGRVDCGNCGMTGRAEVNCGRCHGRGQYSEVVAYQRWDGRSYVTDYQTVWHPCFGCGQSGRVMGTCPSCHGSLKATCGACRGRGRLRCDVCHGRGEIESESRRWLVGTAEISLGFDDIGDLKHRELLWENWSALVEAGDVTLQLDGEARDEADLSMAQPFRATAPLCSIDVRLPGGRGGSVVSVGGRRPARASTPILAAALDIAPDLPADEALTRLAGRRILARAVAAVRSAGKGDALKAARDAIRRDYSVLIGASDGAVAAAAVAAEAEGRPWARRVWPLALIASTVAGAAATYATLAGWSPDNPIDPTGAAALLFGIGAGLAALAWGLLWLRPARRGKTFGVSLAPVPPAVASALGWIVGVVAAPFAAALLAGVAAWKLDWPTPRAGEAASVEASASAVGQAVTTTGVRVRAGPGTDTAILATLGQGERVTLMEGGDEAWARVRHDGWDGYVARRYLVQETKP